MDRQEIITLVGGILSDHGIPRRVKDELESYLAQLQRSPDDGLSQILFILDEASTNPNLTMGARTAIWNTVSALEVAMRK
ncbi:MAG: UPF0147 family protein [Candidatus Aenigmarchaeota archaeon]|nr:UPF0147 family protein [Candidatus Aenigmarchaeota archaeon]